MIKKMRETRGLTGKRAKIHFDNFSVVVEVNQREDNLINELLVSVLKSGEVSRAKAG